MSSAMTTQGGGFGMVLVPKSVDEAVKLAQIMAKASLVPEHLRGKEGDCLLIVMQAQRWGMDALSVAQCTSVVRGKLCYEGKLVSAALYAMGAVEGRLRYEYSGRGEDRMVKVIGRVRGETTDVFIEGSVKQWATDNQNWKKSPDDMLAYRGTRQWARRHAPESLLGVYTPDELEDEGAPTQQKPTFAEPKAASEKRDETIVDAEYRDVATSESEPAMKADPQQADTQQGELPANMQRILDTKLQGAGLTMAQLAEGFGVVSPANINHAFKWISDSKAS
ncbi:MAG: recombinase RecT [Silanimonas sp.]